MTPGGFVRVLFKVDGAYVGLTGHFATVVTAATEAACGFSFKLGEEYVVYAYARSDDATLRVSRCSRTRPVAYAAEDIEFFRTLASRPQDVTIFGTVKKYTYDPYFVPKYQVSIMDHYFPPDEYVHAMVPLTGQKVTVEGTGVRRETVADESGRYEFKGLQPGEYKVAVALPKNFVPVRPRLVQLVGQGCAELNFRTESDGHIRGRIIGRPACKKFLYVAFVSLPGKKFDLLNPFSDDYAEEGSFDIGPLPAGPYILGAYVSCFIKHGEGETISDSTPTFYPGVSQVLRAGIVRLAEGQKLSGYNFRLLKQTLKGVE